MNIRPFLFGVQLMALAIATPSTVFAQGRTFSGYPSAVTDGDTLRFGAVRLRLGGIDAPELSAPNGRAARDALRMLVSRAPVTCFDTGARTYRRVVATCTTSDGEDLAALVVDQGWAWDWPRYSRGRYFLAELRARLTGRGMFDGDPFARRPKRTRARG